MNCHAQIAYISTDRPDQSDGVYTVPKKALQLENGVIIAKNTIINDFMMRYGITNSTEIRLIVDSGKEGKNRGLKPIAISAKQRIINNRKFIPAITFVGYASMSKLASKNFKTDGIPFELKLAFENELKDTWSIGYNIGTSEEFKLLNLSFGSGYSIGERVLIFVEYFSSLNKSDSEHNADTGMLYFLNPNLQIDFALGHSLFAREDRFFSTIGISYLLQKRKK